MSHSENISEVWSSNFGFILACVGSAVGIGNIWRFPYIVGENGGGAFLIPFIIIIASFGVILMVLEFAVGRMYKSSIVKGLSNIRKNFKWAGVFITIVALSVLSFYLVILGWVASFFILNLGQTFVEFDEYSNSYFPVISFFAVLAVTFIIIRKGITSGIEKFNKIGILLLIGIIVPLAVYGLTLEGSKEGLEYFFQPDFDKIDEPRIWASALGQAFFSLSLGSGSLLTYGSYLRRHSLIRSSSIVISANTAISIIAGIMIFSFVFSVNVNPTEGIPLIFEVLPAVFADLSFGFLIGSVFFFLLLIAGLTSAVGLFQVPNASLQDSFHISNKKSSIIIALIVMAVGLPSALSYSQLDLKVFGILFLDLMDHVFGIYGITISELVFVVIVTWFINKKKILEHVNASSKLNIPQNVITIIKYLIPPVIVFTIISSFIF